MPRAFVACPATACSAICDSQMPWWISGFGTRLPGCVTSGNERLTIRSRISGTPEGYESLPPSCFGERVAWLKLKTNCWWRPVRAFANTRIRHMSKAASCAIWR
ncbi:protein of unknown function [Shinella sp. WSC3-e]|nr:protein of unknown function [Shinella sp. WSC3-e]